MTVELPEQVIGKKVHIQFDDGRSFEGVVTDIWDEEETERNELSLFLTITDDASSEMDWTRPGDKVEVLKSDIASIEVLN